MKPFFSSSLTMADLKSDVFPGHSGVVVTPVPLTWIPFSNGMTDAVRHLDAGIRRHDEEGY
jgi:hypothetical protein